MWPCYIVICGGDAPFLHVQAAVLNAKAVNPEGIPRPSVMAFSRQGMPNQPGTSKEGVMKGFYTVHGGEGKPDVIFIASGALPVSMRGSTAALHCTTAIYVGPGALCAILAMRSRLLGTAAYTSCPCLLCCKGRRR